MSDFERNVVVLNAVGQESRLLILQELFLKERCACELPKLVGRTQSNTSMQLSKLHDLGIIDSRRDGRQVIYFIVDKFAISVLELLDKEKKKRDNEKENEENGNKDIRNRLSKLFKAGKECKRCS